MKTPIETIKEAYDLSQSKIGELEKQIESMLADSIKTDERLCKAKERVRELEGLVELMRNCFNCGNNSKIDSCRLHKPVNYACIHDNLKHWQPQDKTK